MPADDPFLSKLYDQLHATPMQQRLRRMAPMPVGCVFLPWPGMTDDDARAHFRLMKDLGFTCLKQTMPLPDLPASHILGLALEEGIVPFWYAEGGFEEITPDLLEKLGLPRDLDPDEAMENPSVVEHQHAIIRRRIERLAEAERAAELSAAALERISDSEIPSDASHVASREDAKYVPGVVGDIEGTELHPEAVPHFLKWLEEQYGSVDALKEAWNVGHVGISEKAARWRTWEDVGRGFNTELPDREYRHLRDILRFRADTFTRQYIREAREKMQAQDPLVPMRAGGEMGLFLPFASRGTDMEGIAREMAEGGSFYPSIHPAWHFEEVRFEVARPVFMQAQITTDWAKGIWTATWESTGGPQYFSGGKSPFVAEMREETAGFTVDAGVMTQLMLSWLAAGFRGFGLWTWNGRTAGWEAGEFALLSRNNRVTPRAIRAGEIGRAARRWRRELWAARKEPLVGVMVDWENEAMWAAMAVSGREKFKTEPVRARIGASRALINANVPWEYVTPANLRAGLGPRYRSIYLPACLSVGSELQRILLDYVYGGGRLVLDMPGWYLDDFGRLIPTDSGSTFEELFGAVLEEFAYADRNTPWRIGGVDLDGFTATLTPTRAQVVATYQNGAPAITEARTGEGTAVVLGAQLSLSTWRPGNVAAEELLVRTVLGGAEPPYACEGALAYRLAAPEADHYFLINDGEACEARLDTKTFAYRAMADAITGEQLTLGSPISIESHSGRWLRAVK